MGRGICWVCSFRFSGSKAHGELQKPSLQPIFLFAVVTLYLPFPGLFHSSTHDTSSLQAAYKQLVREIIEQSPHRLVVMMLMVLMRMNARIRLSKLQQRDGDELGRILLGLHGKRCAL